MNRKTPIRHGDWHEIDGQLVDLSQPGMNPPEAVTGSDDDSQPPPASLPPFSPPASKRRKTTPED